VTGKVLLLAEDHERTAIKSFRNLGHVIASNLGQANTYDVLWAETIIMSQGTLSLGQTAPRGSEEHAEGAEGRESISDGAPQDAVDSSQPTADGEEQEAADVADDTAEVSS
ncbi:MAG: hypothetical protein GWP18_06820, partial [Proteobacteria bacterium]|nr:hypothetical protein [Pseudomonadota bacterium]